MGASHIKGWMEEVRQNEREEAAAEKKTATEGMKTVTGRKGGDETEERRGKTPAEISN